jgi:hypothetical protein
MVLILPLALQASDSRSAILHTQGGVWVNGAELPDATAISPGDVLETKPGSAATLDADGSTVLIQPESIVKFNGDFLTLEHGSVQVITSQLLSVHVDCIKVVPVSNARTQYDVTDVNGTVQVAAHKSDVNFEHGSSAHKPTPSAGSRSATVHEGEQTSRDASEVCGAAAKPGGAATGINSKWIEAGAGAGGGGLILCLLLCLGSNPPDMSPSQPNTKP